VIIPQAFKVMLPSFVSFFVSLFKDTSIAYINRCCGAHSVRSYCKSASAQQDICRVFVCSNRFLGCQLQHFSSSQQTGEKDGYTGG
jgi:hypothetical protein